MWLSEALGFVRQVFTMKPQDQQNSGNSPARKRLSLQPDQPAEAAKERKCLSDGSTQTRRKNTQDTGEPKKLGAWQGSAKKRSLTASDECPVATKRRRGSSGEPLSLVLRRPAASQACASGGDRPEKRSLQTASNECPTATKRRRGGSDESSSLVLRHPAAGQACAGGGDRLEKRSLQTGSYECPTATKRQSCGSDEHISLVRRRPAAAQACASGGNRPQKSKPTKRPASDTAASSRPAKQQKIRLVNQGRQLPSAPAGGFPRASSSKGTGRVSRKAADRRQTLEEYTKEEQKAVRGLQEQGIRLLLVSEVKQMSAGLTEALGEGAYGSCVKGRDPRSGDELVIKTFPKAKLKALVAEASVLHQLRRLPGLQRLVGVCIKSRQLVSHYAGVTAGEYFMRVAARRELLGVVLQVARALQAMHETGIAHNDLKENNVCVHTGSSGPPLATVIDLGLAARVGTHEVYRRQPRPEMFPWLAPELLRHTHACSEASDVYSLGHLIEGALLKAVSHKSLAGVKAWMDAALLPEPEARPSLASLIAVIETLLLGTLSGEDHEGWERGRAPDTPRPGTQPFDASSASEGTC